MDHVLVTGAGGFIGGHLVADLLAAGRRSHPRRRRQAASTSGTRCFDDVENVVARPRSCSTPAARPPTASTTVYNLAADMGGMGFIENNKALCMLSVLDQHAPAAWPPSEAGVERFFYSSSACVYAADKQTDARRHRAQGGRRLPGHARGRLRLGEAVQRAHVPPLPRGLRARRPASPATTTSTARTAPGTAAARRPPPRSAARSSRPS